MPKYTIIDVEDRWNTGNEDEWLWWPRIMWIDPGVVSGVAIFWFDPKALYADEPMQRVLLAYSEMFLTGAESGPNGQVNRFLRMHRALDQEPGLATGIESFTIRAFNQDWEFLAPVRVRAAIEYGLSVRRNIQDGIEKEIELHVQAPNDALTSFTNDRLKAMGLYTAGPDHKNDAKRHGLLWLRKIRAAGREAFIKAHGNEEGWWE